VVFLNPFSVRTMVDIPFSENGMMAKYKSYDYSQGVLIPISLEEQLMPRTLEFAIHTLAETRVNTSIFDSRYDNKETEGRFRNGPTFFVSSEKKEIEIYLKLLTQSYYQEISE